MHYKSKDGILPQDIGLLLFLICVFAAAALVYAGGTDMLIENFTMSFLLVVAVILITFSRNIPALVVAGSQLIGFTAYKLFRLYAVGAVIQPISYLWLILPLAAVGSMRMFCAGRQRLEEENDLLRGQVDSLVMVDPLTGLYNLRSFYYDISRQLSYTERNHLPLTLMIVQLRYAMELQNILPRDEFNQLKQRLSRIVQDAIRLEDRLYSIDSEGGLAILLTCSEEDAAFVRDRLRARIAEKGAFDGIADTSIKVDVRIGYVQYSKEMGKDMIAYKKRVESELQYDV